MNRGETYRKARNISKIVGFSQVPDRVSFGYTIYHPGGQCGPRIQRRFQLMALIEGDGMVQIDDRKRRLGTDQVALFCPGHTEHFAFSATRTTHQIWCTIHPTLMPASLITACERAVTPIAITRRLQQIMELGRSLPREITPRMQALMESLGLAVLQEYLFAEERQQHHQRDQPDALRQAVEWCQQIGTPSIDLTGLARHAGVSPGQLLKLFRRHLNTSPMRYLWETRTRRGAWMLRETCLSVSEVAYHCGFQTPFHFSRLVRRHFGVPPRQLRHHEDEAHVAANDNSKSARRA